MTTKDDKLAKIAKDFQDSMKGLGLAVTISASGHAPVVVTEVCPDCESEPLRRKSCATCGGKGAVLPA